ncbi:MAG: hypothetical protein U0894_19150 [Pirellulales bacterium]
MLSKNSRRGALTIEWIMIVSLIVIGTIGGLAAIRNATLSKLSSLDTAIEQLNVPVSSGLTGS